MKLTPIITRLRATATYFGGRVFGAEEQQKARSDPDGFTLPCAFVVAGRDTVNLDDNGNVESVTEGFGVLALISNTSDDGGLTAADAVDDARTSLRTALEGWVPVVGNEGVLYVGGDVLAADRSALWYAFDFSSLGPGASGGSGVSGDVIRADITVQLNLTAGTTVASVATALAAKLATTTGGTRMASDLVEDAETPGQGEARWQMVAEPVLVVPIDSNTTGTVLGVTVRVYYRLDAGEAERDYTEGASAGDLPAILLDLTDARYWSSVTGVSKTVEFSFSFPGDITRT